MASTYHANNNPAIITSSSCKANDLNSEWEMYPTVDGTQSFRTIGAVSKGLSVYMILEPGLPPILGPRTGVDALRALLVIKDVTKQ